MSGYEVIANVSETLVAVLTKALKPLKLKAELHSLEGTVSNSPARLTVFLFETVEDPSARNRSPVREATNSGTVITKNPPVALLLRYLLTPWSGDQLTDHKILGIAIQTLYDNAILSGSQLEGSSLANTNQALKLKLAPLTLEERTRIWHAVQKPYRLSVTYEVRVVNLESARVRPGKAVLSRDLNPQLATADSGS